MPRLTATSYAVLALLARTPYSAYDLTGEIKASLAQCLPRSATLLYREPKNLVAHGFAEVEINCSPADADLLAEMTVEPQQPTTDTETDETAWTVPG